MKSLINRLKKQNKKISVAESCTGGLISKMITDTAGASAVFDCAVTVYSNEFKTKLLGVREETLDEFGAVSEQTAREMASGVLKLSNADIALSVTGIAGPSNDGSKKPVGTVCIGVATVDKCYATTFVFAGSRAEVRRMAAKMALNMAYDELGTTKKTAKTKKTEKIKTTAKNTAKSAVKKTKSAITKSKSAINKLMKKDK